MKTSFLIILLLSVLGAGAQTVTVEWDPNLETNVIGYRVYSGLASRSYDSVIDVTNVTAVVPIFLALTNYFAVTAYDSDGLESEFSEEVFYSTNSPPHLPPPAPLNVRIAITTTP